MWGGVNDGQAGFCCLSGGKNLVQPAGLCGGDDGGFLLAAIAPGCSAGLWVQVDDSGSQSQAFGLDCEVQGQRGLAGSPLLGQYREHFHGNYLKRIQGDMSRSKSVAVRTWIQVAMCSRSNVHMWYWRHVCMSNCRRFYATTARHVDM